MKCGNDEPKLPSSRRQAGQRRKEDDMHDIETTEYADSFFFIGLGLYGSVKNLQA